MNGPSGPLGTTNTINVCPTTTTSYTATVTNNSCAGPIIVNDVVTVTINSTLTASATSTPSACTANNGTTVTRQMAPEIILIAGRQAVEQAKQQQVLHPEPTQLLSRILQPDVSQLKL